MRGTCWPRLGFIVLVVSVFARLTVIVFTVMATLIPTAVARVWVFRKWRSGRFFGKGKGRAD
jgi:hypothetical protein